MKDTRTDEATRPVTPEYEPGYYRAVKFVYLEMLIAVGVTLFSLYMALTGTGGFPGK